MRPCALVVWQPVELQPALLDVTGVRHRDAGLLDLALARVDRDRELHRVRRVEVAVGLA